MYQVRIRCASTDSPASPIHLDNLERPSVLRHYGGRKGSGVDTAPCIACVRTDDTDRHHP